MAKLQGEGNVFDNDIERQNVLGEVAKRFCPASMQTLLKFKDEWPGGSWEEFKSAQNKVFVVCLGMETSDLGKTVREMMGLGIMTLETEIFEDRKE